MTNENAQAQAEDNNEQSSENAACTAGTPANANVYAGAPDGRQGDSNVKPSRFRPVYRALTAEEKALHDEIKSKAVELETLFEKVKPGRYNSLAVTSLEQSVMWIVKELTA